MRGEPRGISATLLPLLKGEVAARSADGEVFVLRLREAAKPSQSASLTALPEGEPREGAATPLPLLSGEVAARSADGEVFVLRLREGAKPSQSRLRLDSSPKGRAKGDCSDRRLPHTPLPLLKGEVARSADGEVFVLWLREGAKPSQSASLTALPEGEPRRKMSSGSTATIPLPLLKGEVARRADGEVFILRLREGAKPSQSAPLTALPEGEPRRKMSSGSTATTPLPLLKGEVARSADGEVFILRLRGVPQEPSQSASLTALPEGEPRSAEEGEPSGTCTINIEPV